MSAQQGTRKAFAPREGEVFVQSNFSSMEMRVMATMNAMRNRNPDVKLYRGARSPDGAIFVSVQTPDGMCPLDHRLDLFNHSPSGFEWGYGGSGPAQLALAILACHFAVQPDGDERAVRLHQRFKFKVIAGLPRAGWELTPDEVQKFVDEIEAERPRR